MSVLDEYYSAYKNLIDSLSFIGFNSKITRALKNDDKKNDRYEKFLTYRDVDIDFVEVIEDALPYISDAIKQDRRFIKQEEELLPIEKTRKIAPASVVYLAQHTNTIGRIEGDEVVPKELLNIHREEDYDIYENRFLRSLILKLSEFVENVYISVKDEGNTAVAELRFERNVFVEKQKYDIALNCSLESSSEGGSAEELPDVTKLSNFQRLCRIRTILSEYRAMPFIKQLEKTALVRSPIIRTNVLTKDQSFSKLAELWDYIEGYGKAGYTVIPQGSGAKINDDIKADIYSIFSLLHFVIKLNVYDNLKKELENKYVLEKKHAEEEALRLELERKEAEEERVKNAREEVETKLNAVIADCRAEIKTLADSNETLGMKNENLQLEYDKLSEKLRNVVTECNNRIKLIVADCQNEKKELTEKYKAEIYKLRAECEEIKRDLVAKHEAERSTLLKNFSEEKEMLLRTSVEEKQKLTLKYNAEKQCLIAACEEEKAAIAAAAEKEKIAVAAAYNEEKLRLTANCEKNIENLRKQLDTALSELDALENRNDKLSKELERKDAIISKNVQLSAKQKNRNTELSSELSKLKAANKKLRRELNIKNIRLSLVKIFGNDKPDTD